MDPWAFFLLESLDLFNRLSCTRLMLWGLENNLLETAGRSCAWQVDREKGPPSRKQAAPGSSCSPLPLSPEPGERTGKSPFPSLPVKGCHPIFFNSTANRGVHKISTCVTSLRTLWLEIEVTAQTLKNSNLSPETH